MKFLEFYREHFFTYQNNVANLKPNLRFEELRWRANWFNVVGKLLEAYYKRAGGLSFNKKLEFHSHESLDLFPGYYFYQCMLQLIARRQEIARLKRSPDFATKSIFEGQTDMELVQSLFC